MVSISAGVFKINDNDTFDGSAIFIANSSFNPFWYGKRIITIIQIKDEFGVTLATGKINDLFFTETERDETINYTGFAAFGKKKLTAEIFVQVSESDTRAFADPKSISFTDQGTLPPTNGNGGGLKFGSGGILTKITGGFFGLLALCLLTPSGRK